MRASLCYLVGACMMLVASMAAAQDAVPWVESLPAAQQIASQRGQLILLHFYGDNCPPCKALEANVFPRPEFARGLTANYVPVKINASQNRQMAARYGVDRWPTDVVVTADGTPLTKPAVCPQDSNKYLANLDQIAALHRVRMDPNAQSAQHVAYNAAPNASQYQPAAPEGNTYGAVPVSTPGQYAPQQDPRLAGNAPQQQSAYDPRGYQPQEQQPRNVDLRSGFQPAAGHGYAPPAEQHRSMYPTQQMPLAENPRGMQSETSNAVYSGGAQRSQFAPQDDQRRDSRMSLSETSPGTFVQNPVTQPPADAGRSQFQTNNYTAGNAAASPTPAAASPLGLEGFCPVALTEAAKWTKGDARFGAIHRGRTYLFSTQAEQQRFMANPDKYSPMLSGFDAVQYLEQGKLVDGKRQHGIVHEGQMYLFADEAALEKFCKSPNTYCTPVRQAMQQSVTPSNYR